MMRRFNLIRDTDVTGVSGTGKVAEGVQFADGHTVMRWCTPGTPASTSSYDVVGDIATIHGHGGSTRIEWIDEDYDAWRHPISTHIADLDRRHHPDDYASTSPGGRLGCRCEGGVHVCE